MSSHKFDENKQLDDESTKIFFLFFLFGHSFVASSHEFDGNKQLDDESTINFSLFDKRFL